MEMFKESLIKELGKQLGEEYRFEDVKTQKNNNTILSGIRITKQGENVSPVVYVEKDYEECKKGNKTLEMVASAIASQMYDNAKVAEIAGKFKDLEFVKDKLGVALVNYEANKEALKNRPHTRFLDLAVVYLIKVVVDEIRGTVNVTTDLMQKWNIDEGTLAEQSFRNMLHRDMNCVIDLSGIVHAALQEDTENFLHVLWEETKKDMRGLSYLLSNEEHYYGASILLNTPLLDRLATEHNANLIIYPSSVHEIIVAFEDDGRRQTMTSKDVEFINAHSVLREECLSNSVYIYDRVTQEVRIHEMGAPLKSTVKETTEC